MSQLRERPSCTLSPVITTHTGQSPTHIEILLAFHHQPSGPDPLSISQPQKNMQSVYPPPPSTTSIYGDRPGLSRSPAIPPTLQPSPRSLIEPRHRPTHRKKSPGARKQTGRPGRRVRARPAVEALSSGGTGRVSARLRILAASILGNLSPPHPLGEWLGAPGDWLM